MRRSARWLIQDTTDIPDTVSLPDFVLDNNYRSVPHEKAKNPFTCGLSGKTYTSLEFKDRAGWLARALHQELGFQVNQGTEWEKVIGIYTLNTVRYTAILPGLACHSMGENLERIITDLCRSPDRYSNRIIRGPLP